MQQIRRKCETQTVEKLQFCQGKTSKKHWKKFFPAKTAGFPHLFFLRNSQYNGFSANF